MSLGVDMDPKRRGYVVISRCSRYLKRVRAGVCSPTRARARHGFEAFLPKGGSACKRTGDRFQTVLSWRDAEDSATVFALDLLVLEKVQQHYFRGQDIGTKFDFKSGLLAEKQAVIKAFANMTARARRFHSYPKAIDLVKDEYFHFIYQQYLLSTSKAVREAAQNALLASPPETLAASATQTLATAIRRRVRKPPDPADRDGRTGANPARKPSGQRDIEDRPQDH